MNLDPNKGILVVDGSGVDKFRTSYGTLVDRVIENEKARRTANHKGGMKKGSVPWNKGKKVTR